jgi:excisionase family DNA binding protein
LIKEENPEMTANVVPFASRLPRASDLPSGTETAKVIGLTEYATYTPQEVMAMLRLSRGLTYKLLRDGTIPARRMGTRWVIPKKAFHAWLDSGRISASDAGTYAGVTA